jgi:hypothetical protein
MQMKLRSIASTWMLTAFGAIAFLLVKKIEVKLIFNEYNLINLISAMSVMSLFILWLIDQLAYQRLLNSCLVVDLYSEYMDNTKPPIKAMMAFSAGKGMVKYYNWFYFLPMLFFTTFSAIAFFLNIKTMPETYEYYWLNISLGSLFLIASIVLWIISIRLRKKVPYVTLAEVFAYDKIDKRFIDLVNNKSGQLKRHISSYNPIKQV